MLDPRGDLTAGSAIAGYVVESVLGRGGAGVVYACRDPGLDRRVAVKVLRRDLANAESAARFERERRALAKVQSPHVVSVFAGGECAAGTFFAMELLDGMSLAAKLESGPLPVAEALSVALDVARGLRDAAAAGIVHRDVKPANIILTSAGAVLTDFGLARPIVGNAQITSTGVVMGTPHYLAPEVIRGDAPTSSTDAYALGAVIYEMLAGAPPFNSPRPMEVLAAQLEGEVPSLADKRPEAPVALVQLVHRMLGKNPKTRLGDPEEIIGQLMMLHASTTDDAALAADSLALVSGAVLVPETPLAETSAVLLDAMPAPVASPAPELSSPALSPKPVDPLEATRPFLDEEKATGSTQAFLASLKDPVAAPASTSSLAPDVVTETAKSQPSPPAPVSLDETSPLNEPPLVSDSSFFDAQPSSDSASLLLPKSPLAQALTKVSAVVANAKPAMKRVSASVAPAARRAWVKAEPMLEVAGARARAIPFKVRVVAGAAAVVALAAIIVVSTGRSAPLERIAKGEAAAVLSENDAIKLEKRTPNDDVVRGHALFALGRRDDAFAAWMTAAEHGAPDAYARSAALGQLDQENAESALRLLRIWPDKTVDAELRAMTKGALGWRTHWALTLLEDRKALGDVDAEALGIKQLSEGATCAERRLGLDRLGRLGKSAAAVDAIDAARKAKGNACMKSDFKTAQSEVRARLH